VEAGISVERAAKVQAWASPVRAGAAAPLFQMAKKLRGSAMAISMLVMW
jgi:hypothetical protein